MQSKNKKKMNNNGNTFVVVMVSIACMSILVATILATVGYYYRARYMDLENKSNFYYVEQAMDDIYSGVGNDSVNALFAAYSDTVEVMIYYDPVTGKYVPIDETTANKIMKQKFLQQLSTNDEYKSQQQLYLHLRSFIHGIEGTTRTDLYDADGDPAGIQFTNASEGIDYTIELVNPKNLSATEPRMYLEVATKTVGEGAAATTQYDKLIIHNVTLKRSTADGYVQSITTDIDISEPEFDVSFSNVDRMVNELYDFSMIADMGIEFDAATETNESIAITGNVYAGSDYYNKTYNENSDTRVSNYYGGADVTKLAGCNGLNENSHFSGIYNNASNISIMADKVIVPGSISVINNAQMSIMGNVASTSGGNAEVWADNIVLTPSYTIGRGNITTGGKLTMHANAYIADDLEINQDQAEVNLSGNYYGYNYSQTDESERALSEYASSGKAHFNSSAIIVNGKRATIDLSDVENLYVAGRAYIETSRMKDVTIASDGMSSTTSYVEVEGNTDVQTGESISVRSNQIAYMPLGVKELADGTEIPKFTSVYDDFNDTIYANIKDWLDDSQPLITQTISDNTYYFLNFKSATDATKFFDWYANTLPTMAGYSQATDLIDIRAYSDFSVDNITLNDKTTSVIATSGSYTSGALNVSQNNSLTITSPTETGSLINGEGNSTTVNFTTLAKQYNNDYKEMKYTLQVIDPSKYTGDEQTKAQDAKDAVAAMDSKDLTPINYYLDFSQITTTMADGAKIGNYYVWVSDGDVTINKPTGSTGKIMGLIIAKGDVNFTDADLTRFEGLIITGSKIKVNHQMNFIANAEIVKTILRTAESTKGNATGDYSDICKIFKDYEGTSSGGSDSTPIERIEIGDILQYSNWKKNIE